MATQTSPDDEIWIATIVRLAKETGAPIRDAVLKKTGVKVPDVRIYCENNDLFTVQSRRDRLQDETSWVRVLVPHSLHLRNVNDATVVVKAVYLFSECHTVDFQPEFLKFGKEVTFSRSFSWIRTFAESGDVRKYSLPRLDRALVQVIKFAGSADIWLNERQRSRLLSLSQTEESRLTEHFLERQRYVASRGRSENLDVLGDLSRLDDDQRKKTLALRIQWEDDFVRNNAQQRELLSIERELWDAQRVLNNLGDHLDSWLLIELDTEVCLRYRWDHKSRRFIQGFLTFSGVASS